MTKGLTPQALEAARDGRPTDALLAGLRHVVEGDRTSDWWRTERGYQFYSALASIVRPASVFEIGVRFGYSLVAMLRGHPGIRRIVGVDNEWGLWRSNDRAAENLRACGFRGEAEFHRCASVRFTPKERFDLAHVDGDHSEKAVVVDVSKCWRALGPGGVLVVDDMEHCPGVGLAVERARPWLPELDLEFRFPTFRGWWIAVKGR